MKKNKGKYIKSFKKGMEKLGNDALSMLERNNSYHYNGYKKDYSEDKSKGYLTDYNNLKSDWENVGKYLQKGIDKEKENQNKQTR